MHLCFYVYYNNSCCNAPYSSKLNIIGNKVSELSFEWMRVDASAQNTVHILKRNLPKFWESFRALQPLSVRFPLVVSFLWFFSITVLGVVVAVVVVNPLAQLLFSMCCNSKVRPLIRALPWILSIILSSWFFMKFVSIGILMFRIGKTMVFCVRCSKIVPAATRQANMRKVMLKWMELHSRNVFAVEEMTRALTAEDKRVCRSTKSTVREHVARPTLIPHRVPGLRHSSFAPRRYARPPDRALESLWCLLECTLVASIDLIEECAAKCDWIRKRCCVKISSIWDLFLLLLLLRACVRALPHKLSSSINHVCFGFAFVQFVSCLAHTHPSQPHPHFTPLMVTRQEKHVPGFVWSMLLLKRRPSKNQN